MKRYIFTALDYIACVVLWIPRLIGMGLFYLGQVIVMGIDYVLEFLESRGVQPK